MKINRIALILVLFVFWSCPVFSDQDSCEGTNEFYLGLQNAAYGTRVFWVVFGATTVIGASLVVMQVTDTWQKLVVGNLIGAGMCTIISTTLPLAITPTPMVIPDSISEEKVECYLEGYGSSWAAKRNNAHGGLIGSGIGWGVIVLEILYFVAIEAWAKDPFFFLRHN